MSRGLATVSAVCCGMSAGAMLLIRVVLVPFWRGAPPREFRGWFAAHSGRIRSVMVPLGVSAAAAPVASTVATAASGDPGAGSSAMAAGAGAGVVAITLNVNEPANEKFVQPDLSDSETAELLDRWVKWHDVRVALGVAGAVFAARALTARD